MTIFRIGDAYINMQYFVRAEAHENGNVSLYFNDGSHIWIKINEWQSILADSSIETIVNIKKEQDSDSNENDS